MTKRSGFFALTGALAALAIVLPFAGILASPSGAAGTDTATTVTITGNPNPGTTGTITYDVTVAATDGGTPTGTVDVTDTAGGSCSISDITGSCGISENAAGSPYTVTATYNGDTTYAINTGTVIETVNLADQAALSVTSTSGTYGTALTLTTSGGSGTGAVSYAVASNPHGIAVADFNGDGRLDVATANTVAQGTATGLAAYPLLDPAIVGDVAGDYSVDAGDVSDLAKLDELFAKKKSSAE